MNDSKSSTDNKKLYDLLIELAKTGIGNLIRTYSQTDKIHILHTLQMYKTILESDGKGQKNNEILYQKRFENYELQNLTNSHASVASHVQSYSQGGGASVSFMASKREKEKDKKTKIMQKILRDESPEQEHVPVTEDNGLANNDNTYSDAYSTEVKNIDDVFIRITDIYTQEIYNIIYNTLNIMIKSDSDANIYIDGLNKLLEPTNSRIKKWIDEHIVF
jgi:hypothetical protein